uniref:Mitotic checkpoint protein BUB3 n=1 Tax=Physcomitrium patens TaxID=3218 RepID=A0A7I4A138_PHYPA|nr:mitotic checkpoint protein BUB3.1-like isoform X6 [Physcomitrium patens]|eukprot:XP_024386586.1 mitotic checkpoint protein BUB3.1-like isoform X6 [Physcomitrella patens]
MMGGGAPPLFPPPSQQHQHYLDMDANAQPAQLVLGRELASPPADGISNLRFSNYSDHLLVSSWDAKVRLYDASANVLMGQFSHRAPVLDCCFHDDSSCFTASADHSVCRYDFNTGGEDTLGTHDAPVRCVEYSHATGYALSSVEGRIAMEFFDMSEAGQAKKYAFKCHRKSEAGRDTVYPVNAIAFHPIYGTFATGGCDGYVNIWDGNNKKRLYQYSRHEPDAIFVRSVNESEVKPKPKAYTSAP